MPLIFPPQCTLHAILLARRHHHLRHAPHHAALFTGHTWWRVPYTRAATAPFYLLPRLPTHYRRGYLAHAHTVPAPLCRTPPYLSPVSSSIKLCHFTCFIVASTNRDIGQSSHCGTAHTHTHIPAPACLTYLTAWFWHALSPACLRNGRQRLSHFWQANLDCCPPLSPASPLRGARHAAGCCRHPTTARLRCACLLLHLPPPASPYGFHHRLPTACATTACLSAHVAILTAWTRVRP